MALIVAAAAQPPVVIAHRGASGYLPEHTLEALAVGHAMGADYVEPDVVLSRDDVPVVLHDIHLDTVTDVARRFPERKRADGRYYALDFTVSELKQLSVGERVDLKTGQPVFPTRFPAGAVGFQIPTLEEEIRLVQGMNRSTGRNVGIYPEVKEPAWHRKEGRDPSRLVVDLLHRHGYRTRADRAIVQCFDFEETRRIRQELGWQGLLVQLLDDNRPEHATDWNRLRTPAGLAEVARVADGIGPSLRHVLAAKDGAVVPTPLVADAHAAKLLVHAYTARADQLPPGVASFGDLLSLLFEKAGVDGVFSDHPDKVLRHLKR